MVIAALVSFGILLVAWIMAPDEGAARPAIAAQENTEAIPLAA